MPKRSCPFADSSPVQLKTRVRLRELSQGVMGERYRHEIFEKTKQLLFKGTQTYMDNVCNGSAVGTYLIAQYPEPLIDRSEICSWHSCNGQMLIGQDGKLRQPCASEMALPVGVSKACSSCIRTVDIKDVCTQCDQFHMPELQQTLQLLQYHCLFLMLSYRIRGCWRSNLLQWLLNVQRINSCF